MILWFENSIGQRRVIFNPATVKEMWRDIKTFLEERNYKSYYSRINFGEDEWVIDVGSWSEFFIVTDFNEKDLVDIKGGHNDE